MAGRVLTNAGFVQDQLTLKASESKQQTTQNTEKSAGNQIEK
jgi:hypothetical protein